MKIGSLAFGGDGTVRVEGIDLPGDELPKFIDSLKAIAEIQRGMNATAGA